MDMILSENRPPREFKVGVNRQITIRDCATVRLDPDEQVTLVTNKGKEYDIARKDWGYYATPSVNGRLKNQGFKTALVRNHYGKYYVMIVDEEKLNDFKAYLAQEKNDLEQWLDEL
jgi:hypothetical protein